MPLDHYVSQVHLKNFYSPNLGQRLYAVRKSNLQQYACDASSQCRIEDGSTNTYLFEPRIVEEFLKLVEPCYNASIEKLRSKSLDPDAIFSIVGFAAYVSSCAPAAMRIHIEPIQKSVEEISQFLENKGKIPPPPEVLGASTLRELIKSEKLKIKIDPKFPQSMGIQSIFSRVSIWGNSRWDVILNGEKSSPFFTSDFPIAIEQSESDPRILNRIVPLAPDIAIRILPDLKVRDDLDLGFSKLRLRYISASRQDIIKLNTAIVRCAENTVFFKNDHNWIIPFVTKHRNYHIEPQTQIIPMGDGKLEWSTMRIASTK